ncbi:hypothetical protein GDO78_002610 [Eleutherodactylus coqui]|uniref:Uncharacterized protein n=1 Tax=Eleutherodactylus coqui TaxID=57060 RepID=A0A8J6K2X2_ELECQ|nr:hypothetical protein GDO78_002610 [Eleutherodactylus coqui]
MSSFQPATNLCCLAIELSPSDFLSWRCCCITSWEASVVSPPPSHWADMLEEEYPIGTHWFSEAMGNGIH